MQLSFGVLRQPLRCLRKCWLHGCDLTMHGILGAFQWREMNLSK